jgi:hypothetical protein
MTIGFKPRYILAVYLGLCFVFGVASVAMLILDLCFESVCLPFLTMNCPLTTTGLLHNHLYPGAPRPGKPHQARRQYARRGHFGWRSFPPHDGSGNYQDW